MWDQATPMVCTYVGSSYPYGMYVCGIKLPLWHVHTYVGSSYPYGMYVGIKLEYSLFICLFSQQHQRSSLQQAVQKVGHNGRVLAEVDDPFARLEFKVSLNVIHCGHQR